MLPRPTNAAITLFVLHLLLFCCSLTIAVFFTSFISCLVFVAVWLTSPILFHTFLPNSRLLSISSSVSMSCTNFIPVFYLQLLHQDFPRCFNVTISLSTFLQFHFFIAVSSLFFIRRHFIIGIDLSFFCRLVFVTGFYHFFVAIHLSLFSRHVQSKGHCRHFIFSYFSSLPLRTWIFVTVSSFSFSRHFVTDWLSVLLHRLIFVGPVFLQFVQLKLSIDSICWHFFFSTLSPLFFGRHFSIAKYSLELLRLHFYFSLSSSSILSHIVFFPAYLAPFQLHHFLSMSICWHLVPSISRGRVLPPPLIVTTIHHFLSPFLVIICYLHISLRFSVTSSRHDFTSAFVDASFSCHFHLHFTSLLPVQICLITILSSQIPMAVSVTISSNCFLSPLFVAISSLNCLCYH